MLAIILVLSFSISAFSGATIPTVFLDPAINLRTPDDTPDTFFTGQDPSITDPHYSLYKNSAPYSLVARGQQEDFAADDADGWDVDDIAAFDGLALLGLGKIEDEGGSLLDPNGDPFNAFTLVPNPINGVTQGYWQFNSGGGAELDWIGDPNDKFELYFSIKAGSTSSDTGYNLFVMNHGWDINQAVTWSTLQNFLVTWGGTLDVGFDGKSISHIAFWQGRNYDTVPEPATMILFGFGLIGLARIGRSKKIS